MRETTMRWKWWWGFDMEKIAAWLERLECEGWRLERIGFLGMAFYFAKTVPAKASYCVDYQQKISPDYEVIFNDSGWELTPGLHRAGWYFWRKEYSLEKPEIFTDKESLVARNKRYRFTLLVLLLTQLPLLTVSLRESDVDWFAAVKAIQFVTVMLLGYALLRLFMANKKLENGKVT